MQEQLTPEQIKRFEERFAEEQRALLRPQVEHSQDAIVQSAISPEANPHLIWNDPDKGLGRELNPAERFVMGAGAGVRGMGAKVANLLSMMPEKRVEEIQQEDRPFVASTAGKLGKFAGETAVTAPIGAASRALPVIRSLGPIAQQAVSGGIEGAVSADPGDRATGAAYGSLFGGIPELGIAGYKGMTRGMDVSPSARNLLRRGVDLTPGQMNPTGTWGMIEESLQRIPGAGPRVADAREKAWQQTRNAIGTEAAPPGANIPYRANPQDSYNDLKAAYKNAYGSIAGFPVYPTVLNQNAPNVPLSSFFSVPKTAVADAKTRNYAQRFLNEQLDLLNQQQAARARAKQNLQSEDFLELRSRLRDELRELSREETKENRAISTLIKRAENGVTQALESQLPADEFARLKEIDARYGNFKVFENALERQKDRPEGFTPSQFSQSVYQGANSTSQYAGGGGRMRDISKASADVFTPRQPATGASQPSQLFGYAVSAPTFPFYGSGASGKLARALLTGDTSGQEAIRALERQMKRKLPPEQRQALIDYLSAGSAVYGSEKKPYIATTEE